jgi:hypothetical protein
VQAQDPVRVCAGSARAERESQDRQNKYSHNVRNYTHAEVQTVIFPAELIAPDEWRKLQELATGGRSLQAWRDFPCSSPQPAC